MLTFVEETCLLLLEEETGEFLPIHPNILECALVGAVLVDLAFAYRIDTDPKTLTVTDRTPTGGAVFDDILGKIADHPETTDTATWFKTLSADEAAGLQKQVLNRVVERGVLQRQEKKSFIGRGRNRYSTIHREAAREIKERMRRLVLSDEIPDPRDTALLCLVDACNILPDIFPGDELQGAGERIKQLREMDSPGRDVVAAVAEIERVIVAARAHGAY